MMSIVGRSSITPAMNAGRSPHGKLREAVVPIRGQEVDLAPVFAEMDAGTYYVRVEMRTADGKPIGRSTKPVGVKRGAAMSSPIPVSNLEPGLYELILLEGRGNEYLPTGLTAWFLAIDIDQYKQSANLFREAKRLTSTWRKEVDEGMTRGYLKALLIHLAADAALPTKTK